MGAGRGRSAPWRVAKRDKSTRHPLRYWAPKLGDRAMRQIACHRCFVWTVLPSKRHTASLNVDSSALLQTRAPSGPHAWSGAFFTARLSRSGLVGDLGKRVVPPALCAVPGTPEGDALARTPLAQRRANGTRSPISRRLQPECAPRARQWARRLVPAPDSPYRVSSWLEPIPLSRRVTDRMRSP